MCPICESANTIFMGLLGRFACFRCRDCGWTYREATP